MAQSDIASKASAMGANHHFDLTSDVTHLIISQIDTPKYKYVAKNRMDVTVVDEKWVEDMHTNWLAGENIKVSEYEVKHKFPTFAGLKICVTNIANSKGPLEKTWDGLTNIRVQMKKDRLFRQYCPNTEVLIILTLLETSHTLSQPRPREESSSSLGNGSSKPFPQNGCTTVLSAEWPWMSAAMILHCPRKK